jgi:hypothetical protein
MKAHSLPVRLLLGTLFGLGLVAVQASPALAHSGPALDKNGCHANRVRGDYHCHLGELRGTEYSSKGAMLDAVGSGAIPESIEEENFLEKAFSNVMGDDAEGASQAPTDPAAAAAATAAPVAAAAVAAPAAPQGNVRSVENRLRSLKGLFEMDLITQAEYDARRVAILNDL